MSEIHQNSPLQKSPQNGWELLKSVEDKIYFEQKKAKVQIERVFILGKFFPFLLEACDFWTLIKELQYDRNPGEYQDHEEETLLQRVANENTSPEKKLKVA